MNHSNHSNHSNMGFPMIGKNKSQALEYICKVMLPTDCFELPLHIRTAIEKKYGQPVRYPRDCLALSETIFTA
ncbi:MAG: hypothetical protein ACK5D8_11260, partial [Bacteroidota bacterium]